MSVSLGHDYLLVLRGAERTFAEMAACWPHAPIHTLLYDEDATERRFAGHPIRTSFLQRLPIRQRGFRSLLPLLPAATDRLRVDPATELLVTSSSAFAQGLRPPPGAQHVVYCHSPFRYVWHERARAEAELPAAARPLGRPLLERIRRWDERAAQRVDHYIANSRITQERIAEFYGREAAIVHPPVAVDRFSVGEPQDFFLVVGELVPHKNVEVVLTAAERAEVPVRVVGTGPARRDLEARFGATARFEGRVDDRRLEELYRTCRAFVMAAVEEFGIVAVEAMASGRPVLAVAGGGALEFVDERTGVLVPVGDADALAEAMRAVDWTAFDQHELQRRARTFSDAAFRRRLMDEVARATGRTWP
jgi:glycosyltransferase involved in cell wall biosynthesis